MFCSLSWPFTKWIYWSDILNEKYQRKNYYFDMLFLHIKRFSFNNDNRLKLHTLKCLISKWYIQINNLYSTQFKSWYKKNVNRNRFKHILQKTFSFVPWIIGLTINHSNENATEHFFLGYRKWMIYSMFCLESLWKY